MDFSNVFVQATLVEDVYLILTSYFDSDTGEYRDKLVMKPNKSLYGLVQPPLYWYNIMKGSFEASCFKTIPLNPCMFYGRFMIAIIYVDNALFFGTYQDNIN